MVEVALEKGSPWSFTDLVGLPESAAWCYEIVDGCLEMSPAPGLRHEVISSLLRARLQEQLLPDRLVIGPSNLDLWPSYRIPDLVVVEREIARSDSLLLKPSDVRLVIEIVSPGSRTRDRITKPAQYAAAGIGAYWRVETDDTVSVTAYVLRPGADVYTELGTWREGETLQVREPFELVLAVGDCVP